MKIVLLFFCAIFAVIILSALLLIFSTLKLNVTNIKLSNLENGTKKKEIDKEILMYLEIHLFGKLKIAKIKITKKMVNKLKMKEDMKDIQKDIKFMKKINAIEIIKKLKIKFEKVDMQAQIGTENVILTASIVTVISSLIGIIFRNSNYKNINYNIMPMYQFGNTINFNLKCIISVKMVHIIYVIYILLRKGMIKNERTSNRRSYDYSYE